MYSSIHIRGYRGLDSFWMRGLGRVNLLVGTNNCGKTSILECIELLRSTGDPEALSAILRRRGEWADAEDKDFEPLLDVRRLFAGYNLEGMIVIEADSADIFNLADWDSYVTVYVKDPLVEGFSESDELDLLNGDENLHLGLDYGHHDADTWTTRIDITSDGHLHSRLPRRLPRTRNAPRQRASQFIRTSGMTALGVVQLFDRIVLTENEEYVTQALRIIEPEVERIASVGRDRKTRLQEAPGSVLLKLRGVEARIPIGSVGDGMWRMLGLALALANVKGGVLLVDEIDTGLHYSVMADMWRMVSERAAALNVQVFATTHSRDCYESLAALVQSDSPSPEITIQRIDPSREQAIRFSDEAIVAAAERGIEVR